MVRKSRTSTRRQANIENQQLVDDVEVESPKEGATAEDSGKVASRPDSVTIAVQTLVELSLPEGSVEGGVAESLAESTEGGTQDTEILPIEVPSQPDESMGSTPYKNMKDTVECEESSNMTGMVTPMTPHVDEMETHDVQPGMSHVMSSPECQDMVDQQAPAEDMPQLSVKSEVAVVSERPVEMATLVDQVHVVDSSMSVNDAHPKHVTFDDTLEEHDAVTQETNTSEDDVSTETGEHALIEEGGEIQMVSMKQAVDDVTEEPPIKKMKVVEEVSEQDKEKVMCEE